MTKPTKPNLPHYTASTLTYEPRNETPGFAYSIHSSCGTTTKCWRAGPDTYKTKLEIYERINRSLDRLNRTGGRLTNKDITNILKV